MSESTKPVFRLIADLQAENLMLREKLKEASEVLRVFARELDQVAEAPGVCTPENQNVLAFKHGA